MTMEEISRDYERTAEALRKRMQTLGRLERTAATAAERKRLRDRRMALLPLLRECSRMARQTKDYYYERSEDHGSDAG